MSDKTCYELPLAPQNLVAIYKDKENVDDYVLWVDYAASLQKLTAKHIIIYLANTNFKATFSAVDEDLIVEYITSDFMVDSPMLARLLVNIIKLDLDHALTPQEEQLLPLFSREQIYEFINNHRELLSDLYSTFTSIIPFVMTKFLEGLEDKESETDLLQYVSEIDFVDKPVKCGPNIARLITSGFDAFLLTTERMGVSDDVNKYIFNDSPKYFGKDLYWILCQTGVTEQIMAFFPEGFIKNAGTSE